MAKSRPWGSGTPGAKGSSRDPSRPGPPRGTVSAKATSMSAQTAMIKGTDVSEAMQQDAVQCAILATEKYNVERETTALTKRVTMGDQMAVIKDTDMSEEMQQDAVECAIQSLEECHVEHVIAAHIKRISVCS